MRIVTRIDRKANLRTHTVRGIIDVPELRKTLAAFYRSSGYEPGMNSLWDLRDADFSSVMPAEVQSVMDTVRGNWGKGERGRAALLVTRDLDYGLSRMYELLMDGRTSGEIMVFRKKEEAAAWLEAEEARGR